MSLSSRQVNRQKALQKFRLVTARAIFSNLPHTDRSSIDIDHACAIAELCDRYALKILINWFATKCGFPVYASSIDQCVEDGGFVLDTWTVLAKQYPLDCHLDNLLSDKCRLTIWQQATQCLESMLEASSDLVSSIYEQFSFLPLKLDSNGDFYIQKDRARRISGQFYTPPWVVQYCFDISLTKNSDAIIDRINQCARSATAADLSCDMPIRILDPSCGAGNFLQGVIEWFAKKGMGPSQLAELVKHSLYGVDIDGKAISIARLLLIVQLSAYLQEEIDKHGLVYADKQLKGLFDSLQQHLVVADSVVNAAEKNGGGASAKSGEDWTTCLGTFDLVATNPPYVSFGSRDQRQIPPSWSAYVRSNYPEASEYKIRLHSLFQDIALRYLKEGGQSVLLLPDAFLTGRFYEKLRLKLLADSRIRSFTELPGATIGDATVGGWLIAHYEKDGRQNKTYDMQVNSLAANCSLPMSVEALVSKDRSRFRLLFDRKDLEIWLHLDSLPTMQSLIKGRTGIRSRFGQATIVAASKQGANWQKGIVSGSEVVRHEITWAGSWINVDAHLLFAGGFDAEVIGKAKLLVRQTGERIIAALDDCGLHHLNNVHSFSLRNVDSQNAWRQYLWLDGMMNSTLWLYLYQSKSREAGRALAQIDIEMVESMPAPPMNSKVTDAIATLVEQLRLNLGNNLFATERHIDRLVYDLYGLTEAQVEHIESECRVKLAVDDALPSMERALAYAESLPLDNKAVVPL